MSAITKRLGYTAFGLRVWSEIPLPELNPMNHAEESEHADIEIHVSDQSPIGAPPIGQTMQFIVDDGKVWFQIPGTAAYCIQDGTKITVTPIDGFDKEKLRLYILGTCMGALLLQRKVLPLHGSAIAIHGKAYAFVGHSGAGKSTLASAFLHKGFPLVSDDVIAVTLSPDRPVPVVLPSYPQQKLWQESIEGLGMEAGQFRPLFERQTKFAVPVHSRFATKPLLLGGVFELVKTENGDIHIQRIPGLERLLTLHSHTYRKTLISRLGLTEWHFQASAGIVDRIAMYRLQRSSVGFTAPDLASLILSTLEKEG